MRSRRRRAAASLRTPPRHDTCRALRILLMTMLTTHTPRQHAIAPQELRPSTAPQARHRHASSLAQYPVHIQTKAMRDMCSRSYPHQCEQPRSRAATHSPARLLPHCHVPPRLVGHPSHRRLGRSLPTTQGAAVRKDMSKLGVADRSSGWARPRRAGLAKKEQSDRDRDHACSGGSIPAGLHRRGARLSSSPDPRRRSSTSTLSRSLQI